MSSEEQQVLEIDSLVVHGIESLQIPKRAQSALLRHKIDVEDSEIKFNHDNTYKSCCLTIDKRALNYFTQAFFSGSIIAFCIAMLAANQDCATFSRYSPLLTFVIGIWVPNPNIGSK